MKKLLSQYQKKILDKSIAYWFALIVFVGLIIQLAILMSSTNKHVLSTDELSFINNTRLLMTVGYGKEFLVNLKGQAFGPLLNIVHYGTSPFTNLQSPQAGLFHSKNSFERI